MHRYYSVNPFLCPNSSEAGVNCISDIRSGHCTLQTWLELYFTDVFFGFFTFGKQYRNVYFLFNLIILLAKCFIHKCKFVKVTPHVSYFEEDIKIYIKSLSIPPPVTKRQLKLWTYARFLVFLYHFYVIMNLFCWKDYVHCYVICVYYYVFHLFTF